MDFYDSKKCLKEDYSLPQIVAGSDLDKAIKEAAAEVAPLKIGICITTLEEDVPGLKKKLEIPVTPMSMTDRLVLRFFQGKKEFPEYAHLISMQRMSTKFGVDGTVYIDYGKKHKYDCVPADDIEEFLKKDVPDLFYRFVMNVNGKRHLCGLFLYDDKNTESVFATEVIMMSKKDLETIRKDNREDPLYQLVASRDRTPVVGQIGFFMLKTANRLT